MPGDRLGIAAEIDLQPVQVAAGGRIGLQESTGGEPHERPRGRIAAQEGQRGAVPHFEALEQGGQRVAPLDAGLADEAVLVLKKFLDLLDDRRRGHHFDDRARLQSVEVEGHGSRRDGGDGSRQGQQRCDRAELDARARDAIDAMPPTRKHPEPEARIGRKRSQSIG